MNLNLNLNVGVCTEFLAFVLIVFMFPCGIIGCK